VLEQLRIPMAMMPRIVDSTGEVGRATALEGSPPITGIAGDQQSSLIGQGCVRPGVAKITFGTGGMLDVVLDGGRPSFHSRGGGGTFPIVAWSRDGEATWGLEAIMLSAGSNVEWLRDDLGLIPTAEASHEIAQRCESTDGVVYVPALLGLGTPNWDYGARGSLFGITRGSDAAHIVRAVLEGVAHRGADLVEAAETDSGRAIPELRIDGGMSRNPTFVQALADATQRPVEVSPVVEATTLGAAFLAGLAIGTWGGFDDIAATWQPTSSVDPGPPADRERWARAVERSKAWFPELSGLDF
jgi:glycerol kinase